MTLSGKLVVFHPCSTVSYWLVIMSGESVVCVS